MSMSQSNPLVPQQVVELDVSALVSDGRGLGRREGMAVFVEGALPGQRVRARIVRTRKRMAEAELVEILVPSEDENEPPCPHAGLCGGCPWQGLPYVRQLEWKARIVRDALQRVGGIENPLILDILPSPETWRYRNKMEFAFGRTEEGGIVLGLRERGSRTVVPVTGCLLQSPLTMRVLEAVRGLVLEQAELAARCRFLVVREPHAGGCFVELILGPDAAKGNDTLLGERFAALLRSVVAGVSGFALSLRSAPGDVAYGETIAYADGEIRERIAGVELVLGPASFFQVNTPAAELLYAEVARLCRLEELNEPTVWDVYGGIGSIGFSLARHMRGGRLIGVEEMPGAVRYARMNADILGLRRYRMESGDARSVLGRLIRQAPPDVVVVDPPRAGLDARVVQQLVKASPRRILYVSCNPATLARDVARLSPAFRLRTVRPVDLFPQTPHVESVALLEP